MTWQQIQDGLSKIDWGLVIGVIALIFTAVSLQIQRKHYRLSVRPIALIAVADYENEVTVYLQNKGTGPLIVKKLSFTNQYGKTETAIIDFFGSDFENVILEHVCRRYGWLDNSSKRYKNSYRIKWRSDRQRVCSYSR